MQRHLVPASGIKHGDILLTANAEDPSVIYADLVMYTYGDHGVTYAACEQSTFRYPEDKQVTVLRGKK